MSLDSKQPPSLHAPSINPHPTNQFIVKKLLLFNIEKLLSVINRRYKDLRQKCIEYRREIQSLPNDPLNGDAYWPIFRMACESNVSHIIEVALDSIQKLMASSIFIGNTYNKNGQLLIDDMVKTICDCTLIETDKVHLQIVKAILTLATSPISEVHNQSLLMCLRACYNIYLSTKNIDVQTSSRAVLTQIVSAVFQKMERITLLSRMKQNNRHDKSVIYFYLCVMNVQKNRNIKNIYII